MQVALILFFWGNGLDFFQEEVALLRGGLLTAASIKRLLDSLPAKLLRKIEKLSIETQTSVHDIISRGVELFERRAKPSVKSQEKNDRLAQILRDPVKRGIYAEITEAIGHRSNASMTDQQRRERGELGGAARAEKLTASQRKQIAAAAGKASAAKRAAQKAKVTSSE